MDVYNSLQFVVAKMKQYFASPAYLSPFQILYCYCGDHLTWRFPQKAYCGPKVYCKPTGDRVYSLRWSALCTAAHSAAQVRLTTWLRTHYWWKTTFTVHYPLYINSSLWNIIGGISFIDSQEARNVINSVHTVHMVLVCLGEVTISHCSHLTSL